MPEHRQAVEECSNVLAGEQERVLSRETVRTEEQQFARGHAVGL
jgi:hypothetical protein